MPPVFGWLAATGGIDDEEGRRKRSLAVLTGAYSLALLLSGLCAPLVGSWLDRRGPRLLMTAGSILGAISARDYPVVQGVTILAVVVYITVNWLADILQLLVDPRLRSAA